MPRVASSKTETIRVELGVKERELAELLIGAESAGKILYALGIVLAGAGIGIGGYAAYKWLLNDSGAIKWILEHEDWLLKNPILQTLPNLTWLFGGEYSRWF